MTDLRASVVLTLTLATVVLGGIALFTLAKKDRCEPFSDPVTGRSIVRWECR